MLPEDVKKRTTFIEGSEGILGTLLKGISIRERKILRIFLSKEKLDIVYMMNIQPLLNIYLAKKIKKRGRKFIQQIHEPYVEDKSAYGGIQRYWLHIFELLQDRLLKLIDIVVLSSNEALTLFKKRYKNFEGKIALIPLLYQDSVSSLSTLKERHWITFIGPPSKAKGAEIFLDIVNQSEEKDLKLEFQLVSRQPIRDDRYYGHDNLKIYFKHMISDEEFGALMRESIMVLAPYTSVRQSATVATANMYGTPVVATDIRGLREAIQHGITGFLVKDNLGILEWMKGIEYVSNNQITLSTASREHFKKIFSEENWPVHFGELDEQL